MEGSSEVSSKYSLPAESRPGQQKQREAREGKCVGGEVRQDWFRQKLGKPNFCKGCITLEVGAVPLNVHGTCPVPFNVTQATGRDSLFPG